MASAVSFFRANLWVSVLLALTVLSSICLEVSVGFTTVAHSVSNRRSTATIMRMSTVVDNPTKTKPSIEINKDDLTENEENTGKNGWEVQLFNDPYNHRTFVAKCLCTICGKSDSESYQIMMQAHKNGMGVVGRYHLEIAELYTSSLKEEGLLVRMVEVDDE